MTSQAQELRARESKDIDVRVLGTITTGVVLVEGFAGVHEAIEWIVGYPVCTHELPDACRIVCIPAIAAEHPGFPVECPDRSAWQEFGAALEKRWGSTLCMPRGTGERERDPITTLVDVMEGRDV